MIIEETQEDRIQERDQRWLVRVMGTEGLSPRTESVLAQKKGLELELGSLGKDSFLLFLL